MAQDLVAQVAPAVERVDDRAGLVLRDGVDGEVAPEQVLLEGDGRIGVDLEAAIARCRLALGSGEGVLLVRFRVQEDGEVGAHRPVAGGDQLVDGRADQHPVAIAPGLPQQGIANRTADEVPLHRKSLGRREIVTACQAIDRSSAAPLARGVTAPRGEN